MLPRLEVRGEMQCAVILFMVRKPQAEFIVRKKHAAFSGRAVKPRHGRRDDLLRASVKPVLFPEFCQGSVFGSELRAIVQATEGLNIRNVPRLVRYARVYEAKEYFGKRKNRGLFHALNIIEKYF